ncbi:hypothetical protein XENOCAPTIV_028194, partial [Xenoophorus captivus]
IYTWDGKMPLRWKKMEYFRLELPRETLLSVEIVQELKGEGKAQRRINAVHVMDALILNGTDAKVEMTAPVTCHVVPGAGPACESQFTMSFYIPDELQANPPEPSDPDVFMEDRKEFTAYVRTYGGFSNDNMKREELLKLLESLKKDGVEFVDKPYYTAGYDSPFKLTNRRNEVWVLKKTEQQ